MRVTGLGAALSLTIASCAAPRSDADAGRPDAPDPRDAPADARVDTGPCTLFPDLLDDGPEPWPCYEAPWCASAATLVPWSAIDDPQGDGLIPLRAEIVDGAVRVEALARYVFQAAGGPVSEAAAEVAFRIRLVEGRPVAVVETVREVAVEVFRTAWEAEAARVSDTWVMFFPNPVPPTGCVALGDVELWLAPADHFGTGLGTPTLIGVAHDRITHDLWTVEVPMIPWACRHASCTGSTFAFLRADGSGVAFGRPFASFALRQRDYCALDELDCEGASADPDPCTLAMPQVTCDETAWVRSICALPNLDAVPPVADPFCREYR